MIKLSSLKAPAIAGVIREENPQRAIAEMKNCLIGGADMIDLHMSCLSDISVPTLKAVINSTKLPVLALNYNKKYNWQDVGYTEEERVETFLRAVEAGAAGVDIQGYTFDSESKLNFVGEDKYSFTKNNPREIVTDEKIIEKQMKFIEKVHEMGAEVLLSCHPNIPMNCEQVVDLALFLQERKPDIIKIVTIANTDEEMVESIKTMIELKKRVKTPISYHAAGVKGRLTRIINPVLGGQIAFCVNGYNEGSTMEQLDLKTAKTIATELDKII